MPAAQADAVTGNSDNSGVVVIENGSVVKPTGSNVTSIDDVYGWYYLYTDGTTEASAITGSVSIKNSLVTDVYGGYADVSVSLSGSGEAGDVTAKADNSSLRAPSSAP